MNPQLSSEILRAARECGFDLAGWVPLQKFAELEYFGWWIATGRAGEMNYLKTCDSEGRLKRSAPESVFPWARSVIVCALNYNSHPVSEGIPANSEVERRQGRGWISRYAWSKRDYHEVVMERLRRLEVRLQEFAGPLETRCYVDTGPFIERVYARYAGIGWVGKNTCLINQKLGSWLFLGVILTSLPLPLSMPPRQNETQPRPPAAGLVPDRCGACTRCLDACPTNAFPKPYEMDAARCISYLTIEHRTEITEELRPGMGRHVFGCDICQDVCPWNRKAPISPLADFQPRAGLVNPNLEWLATMSAEDFRSVFRGSPIKRTKRNGLRRNAILAIGNSGNFRFLPRLQELKDDPDKVVSDAARWAEKQLLAVSSQEPGARRRH